MPTYQYKCKQCGHELEEFQSMTEQPLVHCPNCDTDNLVRVLGTGGGVIFKGSGFYLTDYKKDGRASGGSSSPTTGKKENKDAKSSPSSEGKSGASDSTPPKDKT